MNPRKAKELLPSISKSTDLPLDLLEDLTDFYWNNNYKLMVSLEHYHVLIPHLGTFSIKGDRKLEDLRAKLDSINGPLRSNPPTTPYKLSRFLDTEDTIRKIGELIEVYKHEQSEKVNYRNLRRKIRDDKENMEQPKANP